jgi:hypothetical protein
VGPVLASAKKAATALTRGFQPLPPLPDLKPMYQDYTAERTGNRACLCLFRAAIGSKKCLKTRIQDSKPCTSEKNTYFDFFCNRRKGYENYMTSEKVLISALLLIWVQGLQGVINSRNTEILMRRFKRSFAIYKVSLALVKLLLD